MENSAIAATTASTLAPRTVLIADAAFDEGSDLAHRLIDDGFEVQLADTAWKVRTCVAAGPISFALLEVRFSDGDAFDLVREIRQANPQARILVHSAHCNLAVAVAATKAGATDVVPKPVETGFVLQLLLNKQCDAEPAANILPCPNAIRKEHIRTVFADCNWNVSRAARQLSMHRRTLQRILQNMQTTAQASHRL